MLFQKQGGFNPLRQFLCFPVRADGHQGGGAFGQEVPAGFRVEFEAEQDGPGPQFLDAGFDAQQIPIETGAAKAAPGLDDGQAKALRDVFEGGLGGQAAGPQEFLDGPVAIAEIAGKIDDAVRVGVPEAHPDFGVVDAVGESCGGLSGHAVSSEIVQCKSIRDRGAAGAADGPPQPLTYLSTNRRQGETFYGAAPAGKL
jgi:hypothetical protein